MNRPLHNGTRCPCCSGRGEVSWLRSGAWINQHCPDRNGPVDVDHSPLTHELDNYRRKRKARIEYKREGERTLPGQDFHVRAELESTAPDWKNLFVMVKDEGQTDPGEWVEYAWRVSGKPFVRCGELKWEIETVGELGRRIAAFLWGKEPA